jgi:hypothetical protein
MQNELMKQIEGLMAKVWDDLKEAADKKDSAALAPLNGRMAELAKMKKDLQGIITRVQEMGDIKKVAFSAPGPGLRKIRIKLTQGMINQNLLTLTQARRNGIVQLGETFRIEALPNHRNFVTTLERVGNKLRERGFIAEFYRAAGMQAGDIVEMIEVSPGSWQLKRAQVDDFPV